MRRYFFIFFFSLILNSLFLIPNIYAGTGLSIQPIKISETINPGEFVEGIITLINKSENAVKVEVTVEDFVPTSGTTNINFVGRAEGNTTVLDWITLDIPDDFVFEKGGSRSINYTIQAPPDAEPGGHFGVVFFKASKIQDTGSLKIGTRLGVLIFVTVPGNFLQKGRILDFSAPIFIQRGPVDFTIKFENTGTVHFEPKGSIKITNIFGKEAGEVSVSGQAVLPTGVRDLNARWDAAGLLLGRYKATLNIVDGEGNVLTAESISFYAFPVWYVISFLIAIAAVFFGLRFLKRRFKISISHR